MLDNTVLEFNLSLFLPLKRSDLDLRLLSYLTVSVLAKARGTPPAGQSKSCPLAVAKENQAGARFSHCFGLLDEPAPISGSCLRI